MNSLVRWGAGCLLSAVSVVAQVTVETYFENEQYLSGEPLRVGVRIVNFSGETLKLGETPDWLDLLVESDLGDPVPQQAAPPVVEPFEVPSAARATRWVDLVPYYDLGRVGRYTVTPSVRIPELGQAINGKPASVNVTGGAKIWQQDFGVRRAGDDPAGSLEVRRYALVQAMNQKSVSLYVRVSDQQEMRVFRVFRLGPVLAFSRPEPQVDRSGQLHVLCQTSARFFTYSVVSPDGELVVRQQHRNTEGRPGLKTLDDGTVAVAGGVRFITAEDIPTPEKAPAPVLDVATNGLAAVPPAATNTAAASPGNGKQKKSKSASQK